MISAHLPPGTKIECVVWEPNPLFLGKPLKVGAVYTLRGYQDFPDGDPGVLIEEHVNDRIAGMERCYWRDIFRIVQLPKLPAEILACLSVDPARSRELEDA